MSSDPSVVSYFWDASIVVKAVMLLLLGASVASWTFIFQRALVLKRAKAALAAFESVFWSGGDLNKLYAEVSREEENQGLASIFEAGFKEFLRLSKTKEMPFDSVMEGVQRAMHIAIARESDCLEKHLPFLATVGSTSPYVGLLGTVWGIMNSLQTLGTAQQATIAMVAPGISEALVATAMGLFAAIPAVIAYNRYMSDVARLLHQYETFQEELSHILYRQVAHRHKPDESYYAVS